jgi:scyllo-inositol 2-dehydrogenase (NADP+)
MREIQVGLIGYGFGGSVFHAPLIRAVSQLRLHTVVTNSRREQASQLPGVQVVGKVADLLSDPAIHLVVVSSPSGTHFELAHAALLAAKHVVVDKPFALTVKEADDLISLAQAKGRVLSPYHNRRWDGDYLTVRHCIEQGWLGTVYHYEAHFDRFRLEIRPGWKDQPGGGSGTLYDLGPHLVDQALQLFGMPRAVTADIAAQRPGAQAIDYFHLVLHYGRMRAVLHASTIVPHPGPHFTIHGDAATFVKHGMDPQEEALKAGRTPGDPQWGIDAAANHGSLVRPDGTCRRIETLRGGYENYYRALAECIEAGARVPVDPGDARNGLAVLEAALRSSHERRTVDLAGS